MYVGISLVSVGSLLVCFLFLLTHWDHWNLFVEFNLLSAEALYGLGVVVTCMSARIVAVFSSQMVSTWREYVCASACVRALRHVVPCCFV